MQAIHIVLIVIIKQTYSDERLPGNRTDFQKCKVSHMGLDYLGHISKTEGKVLCQAWSSTNPIHKVHESYTDNKFPELSKDKAKNYCRNPSKNINGPWCYTLDTLLIDDTCGIPLCSLSECRLTGPGMDYGGNHRKARSDVNCLKWDKKRKKVRINDTLIQVGKFWKKRFPENDLSDAAKFCRNPDGDLAGPWCFTEIEHTSEVEKTYCDIPFCDDQDCMVFSRNTTIYSHYTNFPKAISSLDFGVKLWNPDSYLEAKARLVLTLIPLPIQGSELDDLGIGIEILLSNTRSTLSFGNADQPEYEKTNGILKSTSYTFFNLNWDRGFVTLQEVNKTKPIFLQEFKIKNNLLGVKKNQFYYYSAQGNDILWSFPFCEEDEECDMHTTTSSHFQQFWQLRETESGHDLAFHVRAFHSAFILLVPSPILDYPNIKVMLAKSDNYTRITCTEYEKGPTITLSEAIFPNLLNFWKFSTFSITIFADTLQFFWTKDVGVFMIMDVKHSTVKSLRWYSPSSENGVASWSFYCKPPTWALPPPAFLPECSLTLHETHYVGTQSVAANGLSCLPWSGKKLIPDKVHDLFKKDKVKLLDMYNYCRDPMHEEKGTFCYAMSETDEKRIDKHFCKIRKCKSSECRMAGTGNDYIGKVNTTRSNRTCQYWIADIPMDLVRDVYDQRKNANPLEDIEADLQKPSIPTHDLKGVKFNESTHDLSLKRQSYNFSDLDSISSNMSKSVAVVQNISSSVKDYIKEIDKNPDDVQFIKVHSVDIKLLNGTLYADMTPERAENFCRNPSRSLAGAWCYTMDRDVVVDACNVPDCDKDEMCMVFLRGVTGGRRVYILPQWKETGIHGGIRFSVKQWNPDLSEGVVFELLTFDYKPIVKLIIGAEHNEKIFLVRNDLILQEKTLPHTIPSGRWLSLWLQIRQGELLLGHEGIQTTMFEWISENKTIEANPVYIEFSSLGGHIIALHFTCDECHAENTTAQHFSKIMPINIWTEKPDVTFKNLTLQMLGHHDVKIRLMHLPGSGDNYDLKILGSGTRLELVKNIRTISMMIKDLQLESPILNRKTWSTINITFSEKQINVEFNGTRILSHNSTTPLLFYYFSVAVGSKESWVVWVANCQPLDIDGPPRHGGWSKWSTAVCTVTCGGGEGYRTRTCSNPRPNIFGELCHGSPTSTGKCNEFECGDLSPETFEQIRDHLKSTNFSMVIKEGQSLRIYNDPEILGRIGIESPESYYEWTLNGEFLKPEPGHIDFINDDIVIHNLTKYQSGVYICMLYRINKQRLVIHCISIGVMPKKNSIETRATLPITLDCKGLSLAYVYSDLRQKWTLNDTIFIDYGVTTLAGVSNEVLKGTNESYSGIWKCIIEQDDLQLMWVTNVIKILVKKAPNIYTHLMEDPITRPIFGKMPSEAAVKFLVIFIVLLVCAIVAFALYSYLKWCRLPEQYKKIPTKNKRSNRRHE